jgi:hypothetical protein
VYEREETDFDLVNDSSSSPRGLRGGKWQDYSGALLSSVRDSSFPAGDDFDIGFRVASIPEPSTLLLLAAALPLAIWRRRGFSS